MKFSLVVHGAPYSSESCISALNYADAILAAGHEIVRVFFYHDGVYAANALASPPQDEPDLVARWQSLANNHDIELVACIASCLRRGILDETEAQRYEKAASNLAAGFVISGLGQLIDACMTSDKVMTFGA